MPKITAGTTSTITLAANQTVSFAPDPGETATYVITRAGATVGGDRITGVRIVGPFEAGDSMSITADRGALDYALGSYSDPSLTAEETQSAKNAAQVPQPYQTPGQGGKLSIFNGRLYRGGELFRGVGVNAWDLLYNSLTGGTVYTTDLATIAGYGVKVIRVSAIPNVAADITTYIGATGSAPVSTYAPKVRAFLDEAARQGISVIMTLIWNERELLTALSRTAADFSDRTTATRVWVRDFAAWFSKTFNDHPGLGGWCIANEWVNHAWGNQFLTATSDLTKDHIAAMIETSDDMVAAIRRHDSSRLILSAGGSLGNLSMGPWQSFADRYVASAGACDAVSFHWYADDWLTGAASHAFVGDDLGGSDLLIPALRNACAAKGKALLLDEAVADYDSPPNTIAKTHYTKFEETGCDLLLDWGWYATAGGTPDLKTTRVACMTEIQSRNASAAAPPIALSRVYPADLPAPATAFRSSTSANSWARFAQSAVYQPAAGSPWAIMFWMREPSATLMAASRRVIACNDATGGFLVTAYDQEASGIADHVRLQINCGGTLRNQTNAYGKRRPGEWHHYAMAWDGVASGTSTFACWFDGVPGCGGSVSNPGTPVTSANLLYVGSAADGLSNNAVDVCDIIIVKGGSAILKSQQVADYIKNGAPPANTVFRAQLDGSVVDSVGGIAGALGSVGAFVSSGL